MRKGLTLGKRLEVRRTILGLTQEEAADLIGVSLTSYGRWERDDNVPLRSHRKLIAQAFEVDEEELFND